VESGDGKVYALNAATGTLKWSLKTDGPIRSSPVVANGVVYVGSGDGNLYVLTATTGTPLTVLVMGGYAQSPVVSDGVVYASSTGITIFAAYSLDPGLAYARSTERVDRGSPRPPDHTRLIPNFDLKPQVAEGASRARDDCR
jgi:eukaryotic-like serine/threonine-protein kinase